jgi:hypothetical protein
LIRRQNCIRDTCSIRQKLGQKTWAGSSLSSKDKDEPTIQLSMFSRTNKISSDLFDIFLSPWISVRVDGKASNGFKLYGNTQSIGIYLGNRVLSNRMVFTTFLPDRYSNIAFKEKGIMELCPLQLLLKLIRRSVLSCFLIPGLRGTGWRQSFPGMARTFKYLHGSSHPEGRPTKGRQDLGWVSQSWSS